MDLSGTWRAALADDDLRRGALGLDFDDDGWEAVPVPGHWRSTPAFAESDGPLLYRTRFELEPGPRGARHWVVLDGVFYQGDVWLDGAYLGDPEGYFFPHAYEITDLARLAPEHVLAVEVTCARPQDRRAKRNITGVFQHWDCIDPAWNPGGLWRRVRIERTRTGAHQPHAGAVPRGRARAGHVRSAPSSTATRPAPCACARPSTTRVERELRAAPGARAPTSVEWTFGVDNPRCGGRASLGEQPLSTSSVAVSVDDEPSHARRVRTGLRQVAMRHWVLSVNGERLFLKGANLGPTRMALGRGDARRAAPRRRARRARPASTSCASTATSPGRSSTRPPTSWACSCGRTSRCSGATPARVGKQAARQAAEAVDLLGHHPSVVDLVRAQRALRPRRRAPASRSAPRTPSVRRRPGAADAGTARSSTARVKRALERADGTPPGHRPLRRRPPPPAARRHRQPPLLRLVPRRRA